MSLETRERLLVVLLRISGAAMLLAWPAMLLPVDWMQASHEWLGLGPYPRAAITEYLSRSIAALYAIEGGLMLVLSFHVRRYAPVILYASAMHVVFGVAMLCIDLKAGMPLYWSVGEGPPVAAMGLICLWLVRPFLDDRGAPGSHR